jgi:two-component system sensor histidine kinase/response regulator
MIPKPVIDPINIAIIDDELMNLEMLGFIIRQLGFGSTGIQDSLEAINILEKSVPDLILLDVKMPKMDGFELCTKIKEHRKLKEVPIIFLTGLDQTENKIKGLELGGVDYIIKPFNPLELKARVKTHIELSMAKRKVEEQAKKLKEDIAIKNRMFSIIGHDLRSPLSAAKLKMDFIQRGIIDHTSPDFINGTVYEISRTMDEALNLLQNLLGWGKSESGQIEIIPEKIALHDMVDETFRLLKLPSSHKEIGLINEVPLETHAYADMNTTKTVLRNLVSNAIKFTPKQGKIGIGAETKGKWVYISVTDNGKGITTEDIKKILNPKEHFSQLGTEKEPGTGLGLVLCQIFIKKNEGKLTIDSEPGKGSSFTFNLPLYQKLD